MGFSLDEGYVPSTIPDIMASIMAGVNTQFGTTYTTETFAGTNLYKYFYALCQVAEANDIKASEIMLKLQDYFDYTNEKILNPKVTPNGIIDALKVAGYTASLKPMISADAGKAYICVDVDDAAPGYAATKLAICNLIKDYVVAGVVTQGTEVESLTLTNGQVFDFKYNLPDRTTIKLRLTVTISRNNQNVIASPEDQKLKLLSNIQALYSLGKDFEPERYYTTVDAPWAGDILLEYSLDGGTTWFDDTYEAAYDDYFTVLLANITLIEV